MHSKSQVALFLILGFVLLTAFGFVYYVYQNIHSEKIKAEAEASTRVSFSSDNIKNYLEICFKNLAQEGVDHISARGGYFALPKKSYSVGIINTAYYFYEDNSLYPKIEVLEDSISGYIKKYAIVAGRGCLYR